MCVVPQYLEISFYTFLKMIALFISAASREDSLFHVDSVAFACINHLKKLRAPSTAKPAKTPAAKAAIRMIITSLAEIRFLFQKYSKTIMSIIRIATKYPGFIMLVYGVKCKVQILIPSNSIELKPKVVFNY